jgi:3-deoxy-D-manno-octulosonate 8-phosphate phosphatase (KDO 8-P phosphatase)
MGCDNKKINLKEIDLIVYDFDGVMTNNKVIVSNEGAEFVVCSKADGMAVQKIKELNIPQIILSSEYNSAVKTRADKLKIDALKGKDNKLDTLKEYCQNNGYNPKKVLYIGNDINDLEIMQFVACPLCPSDAHEKIKQISIIIFKTKGGEGVIRELYDLLIA